MDTTLENAIDETLSLEQQLWAAYRLGHTAGIKKVQPVQFIMPVCPLHLSPLWTETEPKPDGSWLYCPLCRQNQFTRETEEMKPVRNVPGMHRTRLAFMHDNWLNSDTSEEITSLRPVVRIERNNIP